MTSRNSIITCILLFLYLVAGGCYAERISLELLEPASVILPTDIQKVSVLRQPGTLSKKGTFDNLHMVQLDSSVDPMKIKMGYVYGLFDVFNTSPRFQRVILSPGHDDSSIISKETLYWEDLMRICTQDSTETVLILTKAVSKDYVNSFNVPDYLITGDYKLMNETKWVFYDPFKQTELFKFQSVDTIVIRGGFDMSELDYLLYDVCLSVGMRIGNKLVPHWKEVDRIYFTGPGKDLKDAGKFVLKNHWYKASLLWEDMIEGSNNTKSSRAAFNTALAYEQNDNLDQASLWINYADSLSHTKLTESYKKVLDERLKLKIVLDAQIAGN